jgi:hypothetical protein
MIENLFKKINLFQIKIINLCLNNHVILNKIDGIPTIKLEKYNLL